MSILNYTVPGFDFLSMMPPGFDISVIAQPTDMTCWAAVGAMMMNWHDVTPHRSISNAMQKAGPRWADMFSKNKGLFPQDAAAFAHDCGMSVEPVKCYSLEGWVSMLRRHGPVAFMSYFQSTPRGYLHARILIGFAERFLPIGTVAAGARAGAAGAAAAGAALGVVRATGGTAIRAYALVIDPGGGWRYDVDLQQFTKESEDLTVWVKYPLHRLPWFKTPVMESRIWYY